MAKRNDVLSQATAVSYVRGSTDKQVHGPADQREKIAAWSAYNSIPIIASFEDAEEKAKSGTLSYEKRPGLNAAVEFIEENKVDFLVVLNRGRVSRGVENIVILEAKLRYFDPPCRIMRATDDPEDDMTPESIFSLRVLDAADELEVNRIRQRTKVALKQARLKGHFAGPKGWETFPRGQRTIQLIKKLSAQGMSNTAIVDYCYEHDVFTPHRGVITMAHIRKSLDSSYAAADLDETVSLLALAVKDSPYYESKFVTGGDVERKRVR